MPTINGTPGVDYSVAPVMSQTSIDMIQPQNSLRQRYRLKSAGTIRIGTAVVTGPQPGLASQLVWLEPGTAAEFGTLLELNS